MLLGDIIETPKSSLAVEKQEHLEYYSQHIDTISQDPKL